MSQYTIKTFYILIGIIACVFSITLLSGNFKLFSSPSNASQSPWREVEYKVRDLYSDILNSTLGFQALFAINLPERSDHRDALTLTGALTDVHIRFVDGVRGDDIPESAFPPGKGHTFQAASKGSWRAHMNAIRRVVEEGLGSALIFEDDVDWDIRIKEQLQEFALSSRALIQPLKSNPQKFMDPTFPDVKDPLYEAPRVLISSLPNTVKPEISPYGDSWDVLWLGHCGIRRPQVQMAEEWKPIAQKISKGYIIHQNDPTVPERKYITVFDDDGHPRFRQDFPEHSRVVHHSMDGICSLAYAVSQKGARSLLYELGMKRFDNNFDLMLREFCDGQNGREKHVCLTVQPTLFDHHRPPGLKSHESDISEHGDEYREIGVTNNVRFSTRLNIEKLLKGRTDYDDQYPDTT